MTRIDLSAVLSILVVVTTGCSPRERETSAAATPTQSAADHAAMAEMSAPSGAATSGALTLVSDRSQVCMVNDQFMGRPQIPVEVDGRTYYGCCEMCKGRLARDASSRTATDPVSKRVVDKSQALIARNENGAVTYFENEASFKAYPRVQPPH